MPSWQSRLLSAWIRAVVRRRDWGDEQALVKRSRKVFGIPRSLAPLYSTGVKIRTIESPAGEWIIPARSVTGAILYFHGGGYVACSPVTHRPITARLAKSTRLAVFAPEYRLAPEHRFPAALNDAVLAYRWLVEDQRMSPGAIAVAGDSAGGGLVLAVLLHLRDEGLPLPACGVCHSPWTDLSGSGASLIANEGRCAMFYSENIRDFAAVYLGTASATDPRASPLFADLSNLPPLLLQVGSSELLLDDARRVHEKVLDSGGKSVLEVYDDTSHGWQMLDSIVPEARQALRSAADFVMSHIEDPRSNTRARQ